MTFAFKIAWSCLFFGPLISLGIFIALRNRARRHLRLAVLGSATLLTLVIFACSTKISLASILVNLIFLSAAYLSFCFLAASTFTARPIFIRIPLVVATYIPIIIGYILTTIGVLGLMFIMGDYTNAPKEAKQMRPGLDCRTTMWGGLGDSGYTVHLYKYFSIIPFIRHEVRTTSVDESYPESGPISASCDSEFFAYNQSAAE